MFLLPVLSTPTSSGELAGYLQVLASLTSNICKLGQPSDDDLDCDDELDDVELEKAELDAAVFKEEVEVL